MAAPQWHRLLRRWLWLMSGDPTPRRRHCCQQPLRPAMSYDGKHSIVGDMQVITKPMSQAASTTGLGWFATLAHPSVPVTAALPKHARFAWRPRALPRRFGREPARSAGAGGIAGCPSGTMTAPGASL